MKVLVVQAKGNGGFAEPQTGAYISSAEPSAAPDNSWVRNLIDKGNVELLAELGEKSDWETFIGEVNRTPNFVYSEALTTYRDSLGKKAPKTEVQRSEKIVEAEKPVEPAPTAAVKTAPEPDKKSDEEKK